MWILKQKKSNSWKKRVEKWLPEAEVAGIRERLAKGYEVSAIR